ncbi:MAG: SAM-dependent methyltransferase [Bacteroides sp.]|nr:SAM-dependent methyltransferase [Prevotella sp.]MCM1408012.1 class I SAM-dependent methyltransferase [Treponema brennaborense]MCM1468988.1 SAM-dependent methyltransferase [Bacteroides sp.]
MDKSEYFSDTIRAVDAKFEAQKIAFSPLTFQAVRAMLETGILRKISDSGDEGASVREIAESCGLSEYGVSVLAEMALGMNIVKLCGGGSETRLTLGKTGWFLLEDDMTRINFDFVNDICYKGAWNLTDSVKTGRPEGLKEFGSSWTTIYEALSSLPEQAKKSWFAFDHFYSDIAFPEALPIVFSKNPSLLLDIGGNTAKWAIRCCEFNKNVRVIIADLPGQTASAEKNAAAAGFSDRITTSAGNILNDKTVLPQSADAVWMSQFLDCFSLRQITKIMKKIAAAADTKTDIWILEPLWDMQKFRAASYSLQATSLYFTCMANGNSKMYSFGELTDAVEAGGFSLVAAHHNLGSNNYSLLNFRKAKNA